jgi:hypothetical protein
MKKLPFPVTGWTLCCTAVPDAYRRVLVWHRVRPWSRVYLPVIGWFNTEEWMQEDGKPIYRPLYWKDICPPEGVKGADSVRYFF